MDLATSTWALVVGIDQYQGSKIRQLKGSARDAVAAVTWLRSLGVPDRQILFHAHPNPAARQDVEDLGIEARGCTNDKLVESILDLERRKGARLFIFLSGHGLFEPTTGPLFLTQDARDGCMRNLGLNEYIQFFMSFRFPAQFLFLDGCLNHPYGTNLRPQLSAEGPPARIGTYTARRATTLWACMAAENGETAREDDRARRGLFLRHLLEAVDPDHPHPEVLREDPKTHAVVANLFYAMYKVVQPTVVKESMRKGRAHHPGLGTYGRRSQRPDSVVLYSFTADAASRLTSAPVPVGTVTRPYVEARGANTHELPPPRSKVVGRKGEISRLVARALEQRTDPVLLLGPRGVGKSTVCLAALRDPEVEHRFGSQRYHVGCDGVESHDGVVTELARALGASWPGEDALAYVRTRLSTPSLVVVDGLDLAWRSDTAAIEALLREIARAPGVMLVATLRGDQLPSGVRWKRLRIGPLDSDDAQRVFLGVAGDRYQDDPHLDDLVTTLGGVPLALERLAYLAEPAEDLQSLLEQTKAALERAKGHADVPVRAALELSLRDPRLTPDGLRLLHVLALLPDGLPHERVTELLRGIDAEKTMALVQRVGLAHDDSRRVRARQEVREHLLGQPVLDPGDLDVLVRSVLTHVAAYGPVVGGVGGASAAASLSGEIRNVTTVLQRGLDTERALECVIAAIGLGGFLRFSGLGSTRVLEAAAQKSAEVGAVRLQAECERALADISLYRSSYDKARERYKHGEQLLSDTRAAANAAEAEAVSKMGATVALDPAVGRAVCIKGTGHVAVARQEYDLATERYTESLELCRRIGERLGEADNLAGLADVAMALHEHKAARRLYDQAEQLYKGISHTRGIANCIAAQADVDLVQHRLDQARRGYEEAHPLFAEIGHVHGEGKCFKGRADVALRRGQAQEAIDAYRSALHCYEQIGDVLRQVECLDGLVEAYRRTEQLDQRRDALERVWEFRRELVRSPPAAEEARRLLRQL
jgi:tetratricopeptide (TPR) repeat protein